MSGNGRPDGYKHSMLRPGAGGSVMGAGRWPNAVHYAQYAGHYIGEFAAPAGAAFEWNFGRPEDYATSVSTRAQASKALLLVDSVRLTRECLSHLLSTHLPDFEIVSVPHAQLVTESNSGRPDVVLLNVGSMRVADGSLLDSVAAISASTRRAPMLLLTEHGEPSEDIQAADFGMVGLFPLTFGVSLLIAAIYLVVAGGQFHVPVASARNGPARLEGDGGRR